MKIKNPLIVMDIESTGVWVEKDKIIEIALLKYNPDGSQSRYHRRINPGIAIPHVVTQLTGISDGDVKDAPYFKQVAQEIVEFIGSAEIGGFNVERFDLPLLERELADAGIRFEWKERRIYDAQKVFHLNEKRDLSAAYQFYCGRELEGAHSAVADSEAVYEILKRQVEKYGEGAEEITVLDKFEYQNHTDFYDEDKRFCWWNGKLYPAFGKYRRKLSLEEIAKRDSGYLLWLLKQEFKDDARGLVQAALNGKLPVRKPAGEKGC